MTEGEIRKTIMVDTPPEVVFKALTDEKELVRWMSQEATMDPRLGGEMNSSTTRPKKAAFSRQRKDT